MDEDLKQLKRTAYALGELDRAEAEKLFAELASTPDDVNTVREIRQTASQITDAMAVELQNSPGLTELQRLAIETRIQRMEEDSESRRSRLTWQRVAFWVPTALAACALLASGVAIMMHTLDQLHTTPGDGKVVAVPVGKSNPDNRNDANTKRKVRPVPANLVLPNKLVFHEPVAFTESPAAADTFAGSDARHAFRAIEVSPVVSFPVNVERHSADYVNKMVDGGYLPDGESLHVSSMINAYVYDDVPEPSDDELFVAHTEISQCPWKPTNRLARVVLRARDVPHYADAQPELYRDIIAEDVRVHIEFNPARVAAYRVVGYENSIRSLDPTEKGVSVRPGHTVTVLYEIVPRLSTETLLPNRSTPQLKYQRPAELTPAALTAELLTVNVAFRQPDSIVEQRMQMAAVDPGLRLETASDDFKFAAAVAEFGLLLIDSPDKGAAKFDHIKTLAQLSLGGDRAEERAAFVSLVEKAEKLATP